MTKDIEWAKKQIILEITESTDRQNPQFYANFYIDVGLKVALSFLDQLDEPETLSQELPVIPKFVSDYIKWYEKSFIYTFDTDAEYIIYLLKVPLDFMGCKRVKDWRDKSGNAQKLIDAYRWGYEVEERELTVKEVIKEHIELLKKQEVAVNLKPYYDLLESTK